MRLVVLPSGLVTPARTAAEPPDTNVAAAVYPSPGRRIICEVAPASRMAVTAAWTDPAHEFNNPWVFTARSVSTRPKTQGEVHTVVWLVHQAHHHLFFGGIFSGQLLPEVCEISVGGTARNTDDSAVPAGIIVNIDDAVSSSRQATLH